MKAEEHSQEAKFIARVRDYAINEQDRARDAFRDIQKQVFGIISASSAAVLSLCVTFLDRFAGRADFLLSLTLCLCLVSMICGTLSLAILARWYRELMNKWVPTVWVESIEEVANGIKQRDKWKKKAYDGTFLGWVAIISFIMQFTTIVAYGMVLLYCN